MVVRESVIIHAPVKKVWQTFVDLTCWADWNTVLENVSSPKSSIQEGERFRCSVRPYVFPIFFEPRIEEVIPYERVVWIGEKFWIRSRHEFLFRSSNGDTEVISSENFSGLPILFARPLFPREKIGSLNADFLRDLRKAAEGSARV